MAETELGSLRLPRRTFLTAATAAAAAALPGALAGEAAKPAGASRLPSLENAVAIGRRFMAWQSSAGGPDLVACPYRSRRPFDPGLLHGIAPATRALYRLFVATGDKEFKTSADRYATFMLATLHDPITPYSNLAQVNGKTRNLLSAAWLYGKGLSPCYEWFVRHNPGEDAFELRAHGLYRALQKHRREEGYFGVGYPAGKAPDAQFSCDLGEVGTGLVGFYNASRHPPALEDAIGLATFFLTDYRDGSGAGVWSPKLGVWLVGPWPGSGAEHFTDQVYNQTGWGWSCLVVGEFLLALRTHVTDDALRSDIAAKCAASLAWCLDRCQFDDGAQGMFARDDKWLGMTAIPVMLYARLREQQALPEGFDDRYGARVRKAWRWLLEHSGPETMPEDGYLKVTGRTSKDPPENLFWQLALAVEALLDGGTLWNE